MLLARYSAGLMGDLRERASLEYGAYMRGSLQAFRNARVAASTLAWARRLAAFGLEHRTLTVAQLVAEEPALGPIADALVGGMHMPHDAGGDAYRYCCAMAAGLQKRDVQLHYGVRCHCLSLSATGVAQVAESSGRRWHTDKMVLAAGSYSAALARSVGLALPVQPVKGYSITVPRIHGAVALRIPVIDPVLHMAAVPLEEGRLARRRNG